MTTFISATRYTKRSVSSSYLQCNKLRNFLLFILLARSSKSNNIFILLFCFVFSFQNTPPFSFPRLSANSNCVRVPFYLKCLCFISKPVESERWLEKIAHLKRDQMDLYYVCFRRIPVYGQILQQLKTVFKHLLKLDQVEMTVTHPLRFCCV